MKALFFLLQSVLHGSPFVEFRNHQLLWILG